MGKTKSNFSYNYPRVVKFLDKNGYDYKVFDSEGQHIRILGNTCLVDLWPSKMTYHIIEAEFPIDNKYPKLCFQFDKSELETLLNKTG